MCEQIEGGRFASPLISINAASVLDSRLGRAMRPRQELAVDRIQTLRMLGAGAALSIAAISAMQALAHQKAIAAMGVICGQGPSSHCAWCAVGLVAAAVGITLVIQGVAPESSERR